MNTSLALCAVGCALAVAVVAQQKQYPYPTVRDQRGAVPPGPRVGPWNSPPLGDGPFLFDSYEQRGLRAVVMVKGLAHPWSIAFLPDDVILITERQGRLRVVRSGKLEPEPVGGVEVEEVYTRPEATNDPAVEDWDPDLRARFERSTPGR